jgi:electron transfer flavoprotein beta subunit
MKVLVLLEVGADVRVPPDLEPRSGRIRADWMVRELDPACERALDVALKLKAEGPDVEVTALHLGPAGHERWLRLALQRGADDAIRVWSEELGGTGAAGKAVVLAAAAQAAGFDLVLAGATGVLGGSGQLGVLVAERLGVTCVTQAVGIDVVARAEEGCAEIVRGRDRGLRERVAARLPLVATVSAGPSPHEEAPASASAFARLRARSREVPVWDLADLGVPLAQVRHAGDALRPGPPRPARPRLHGVAAPDSSLPAFERILKLVEGSVQRREGRVVRHSDDETAEAIFDVLRAEGWLDHLRSGDAGQDAGPDRESSGET